MSEDPTTIELILMAYYTLTLLQAGAIMVLAFTYKIKFLEFLFAFFALFVYKVVLILLIALVTIIG